MDIIDNGYDSPYIMWTKLMRQESLFEFSRNINIKIENKIL